MINKLHDRHKKVIVLALVILLLLLIVGWILFSLFAYKFITMAYEGKAGILNGLITGQPVNDTEYYIAKANKLFIKFNVIGLTLIITLFFAYFRNAIIKLLILHYKKIALFFFFIYLLYSTAPFIIEQDFPFVSTDFIDNPIIYDDYAWHYVDTIESATFFRNNYRFWGYSPFYHAGYPSGVFLSVDNHWAILFNLIAGKLLDPAFVFNLAIFVAYLILPILAFYTARNYGFTNINSLFVFVLSMCLISGFAMIVSFHHFGGYGYVLGVFLSFYTSSILFKYINDNKNFKTLALLTLWGSLTFFVHPLTSIICLSLCFPMIMFYFRNIGWKDIINVGICILIILVANSIWLFPYFVTFSSLRIDDAYSMYLGTAPGLYGDTLNKNTPFLLLSILFVLFLYDSYKNKNYSFAGCIVVSYAILFIIAFYGTQIGLSSLQPMRFIIPLALLSILAISSQIDDKLSKFKNYLFVALLLLFVSSVISLPHKHVLGFSNYPAANKILSFIKNHTSSDARIQVQDSRSHVYFWSHFTAFIPLETSRETLAGTFTFPPSKFRFTQFIDDTLFGKSLDTISDEMLEKYMELYNIKYFLIFSEKANNYFARHGKFKVVFTTEWYSNRFEKLFNYYIYEYLDADEKYCYKCDAVVKADYDKITIENAKSDKTILKYHYIKTLKIYPETLKIKPIRILNDPIPFIMVENGNHESFYIYND